jgi:phospholipase D1/2
VAVPEVQYLPNDLAQQILDIEESKMAGSRTSSPSPVTRDTRSISPKPANGSALRPSRSQTSSPLSAENHIDEVNNRDKRVAGEASKSTGPGSVRFAPLNGLAKGQENMQTPPAGEAEADQEQHRGGILKRSVTESIAIGSPFSHSRRASDGYLNVDHAESPDREKKGISGSSTPPGRRSVQFARETPPEQPPNAVRSRSSSNAAEDEENQTRDHKSQSLLSKLKALAVSSGFQATSLSHSRSPSALTANDNLSPTSERGEPQNPILQEEGSDADADAETSPVEEFDHYASQRKKRKKSRRFPEDGPQTAPVTPKTSIRPGYVSSTTSPVESFRPRILSRRATTTDMPDQPRGGVSEDEGRDRLNRESPWRRRGSAWLQNARGLSYAPSHRHDRQGAPDGKRPSNLRRFTGFGGEGSTTSGAQQRWRQLKASIKMMGTRKKIETPLDHAKSAELLAELTAGAPAALLLASMFQRDEHGSRRVPVLLEQLRATIADSEQIDSASGDRHQLFRILLEYGSGMSRMKWVIHRTAQDFAKLHLKYRVHIASQKYLQLKGDDKKPKLPRFPRSAFPYLRSIRNLDMESEGEEEDDEAGNETGGDGNTSGTESKKKRRRRSVSLSRRRSSIGGGQDSSTGRRASSIGEGMSGRPRETYAEKQRKKLETYLQQLIRFLIFRPDSSRLCKFLELSALGVRLAAESTYHGKEGLLVIQSSKGLDFRRTLTWKMFKGRHTPKWFLVRQSYIVCVDSPEGMNIYDVFLVDASFEVSTTKILAPDQRLRDQKPRDIAKTAKESATHPQHHRLKIKNSERKLKLFARSERQLSQFEKSISFMKDNTDWAKANRFGSFAPVRKNVFAQWLVDGRDYMWVASRAISQAKDVIYIHDWWLSPEIYMRRPAAISQKWRLDRLLKRKAEQGVKIFVIMYRNINSAIPIDSEYSKFSLLDLHKNVFVQRSPNQFRQNLFFWAHHEKICIVDHTVAFVGGIDLCFGRWDTPQHSVVDDKLTGFEPGDYPKDADHCQLWPGKDYSNPRVQDFYALDRPYEEMYDRAKVPRMPWHDIHMQVVGQPARDLTRHFVQRWNYVLRQRKPTRPTPFLLPPTDFNPGDLEELGLDGSCEVQILRSCGNWSIGTPDKTEDSIHQAYIKMIEKSEHFIYIENQFFITSCEVETTKIENRIGDALVERIIRAARDEEEWRAVVVIPLMPGFQNTVDSQDGTSVRLIMQCQFRSICRGESSIFGRLRAQGIEPEDYIQFYSLRSWGKIGPTKQLVTEQLYIHAKCMIVDDRIAIIGSANINERSMLGNRDSECAAVVRDTHMLTSRMNGEPYQVGRFAHTLRIRLMREHLGLDVDEIASQELEEEAEKSREKWEQEMDSFHGELGDEYNEEAEEREREERILQRKHQIQDELLAKAESMFSFNHDVDWEQGDNPNLKTNRKRTEDARVTKNADHRKDVEGEGPDKMADNESSGFGRGRDTAVVGDKEVLATEVAPEGRGTLKSPNPGSPSTKSSPVNFTVHGNIGLPPLPKFPRMNTAQMGLPMVSQLPPLPLTDDSDIGGPAMSHDWPKSTTTSSPFFASELKRPFVDKDCMRDPIHDLFFLDTWHAIAENNTKLFRQVFRCMPDNEVRTWKDYKEYTAYSERFSQLQEAHRPDSSSHRDHDSKSGPPGAVTAVVPAEKISALAAIGETLHEVEKKAGEPGGKLVDLVHNKDKDPSAEQNLQTWAAEANRAQAAREERARASLDGSKSPRSSHEHRRSQEEKQKTSLDEKHPLNTIESNQGSQTSFKEKEEVDNEKLSKEPTPPFVGYSDALNMNATTVAGQTKRRRRATTRGSRREFRASDDIMSIGEAEELLKMVQGRLVVWPYDWYVLLFLNCVWNQSGADGE